MIVKRSKNKIFSPKIRFVCFGKVRQSHNRLLRKFNSLISTLLCYCETEDLKASFCIILSSFPAFSLQFRPLRLFSVWHFVTPEAFVTASWLQVSCHHVYSNLTEIISTTFWQVFSHVFAFLWNVTPLSDAIFATDSLKHLISDIEQVWPLTQYNYAGFSQSRIVL